VLPQRPEIRDRRSPVITLLFLGLICKEKGIFDLLEVLSRNRRTFSNRVRLVIGGNGEVENLRRVIRENGLEHMVSFRGWVTDHTKHQLMVSSDLFILPSYGEGMPVSILEALSYGKAVIATRVGGIPEIVKHEVNGLLITPGDLTGILHSICYYLNDPLKILRHGQASRPLVRDFYPENVMKKVETLYQSLI
ncbi:MAG TPA: glycosyltransferase family 4 protein, partial [Sphingobacteriaceae bacterium]